MSSEQATQQEIRDKGKTAPRITPEMLDAQIAGYITARVSDIFKDVPGYSALQCLTICIITTKNGFTLVGKSACASPENFDHDLGVKIAYEDARKQLWALEGYQLRTNLTAAPIFGASALRDVGDAPSNAAAETIADTTDYKALYETTREVSSENYASLQSAIAEIQRLRTLVDPSAATQEPAIPATGITIEDIGKAAHAINTALCAAFGDTSHKPWDETPENIRNSIINGVALHVVDPLLSPAASHESWMAQKVVEGWKYGKKKDFENKTHPCFLPYDKLSDQMKSKDYVFKAVVTDMAPQLSADERASAEAIVSAFKAATAKVEGGNTAT